MRTALVKVLVLFALLVGVNSRSPKIHANIHNYYATHAESEEVSSMLLLKDMANVDKAVSKVPYKERGQVVYDVLTATAAATQPSVIAALEELGIEYRAYWLVNMIVIQANYSMLSAVALHDSIRDIHPNFEFRVELETPDPVDTIQEASPNAIEWNINRVKAPDVWNLGYNGKGFTVAIADTGVQWDHPALKGQYRGYTDATKIDHNYNWWDAVHATGSKCGANSKVPCDDSGHGTHTTGTAAGTDGGSNQIGVAPGAKWIGCRNMNAGLGSPVLYIECLQYFVAPTDLNGVNANPSLRPHVIGNSYGCPSSEGCVPDALQIAVTNVVNAGIFMSVSAGNSGPSCSTVDTPPAIYANVFSVGALTNAATTTIASYSSRGPVTIDKSNIIKPEISAPGSGVRSSYPTNSYSSLSGTSMASPHITGIIALLWQARPELERDIVGTTKILTTSAVYASSATCGSTANSTQNNVFGYGAVDVLAAVNKKF